ncbi:MAG: DUF924 family protein [Gammaproteobacteria bacterium]
MPKTGQPFFSHRNRALGRTSTPEEIAYLTAGGASFGQ